MNRSRPLARLLPALLAVLLLTGYWYSTHPPDFSRGYANDMCNHEMARQLMSEQIQEHGRPYFVSDKVMTPMGMDLPFYAGWNIERDWIGSYFWKWDREFPFLWAYHGVSLLLCLVAVAWVATRMGLGPWSAWGLALAVTAFNLPRHMKLWFHSDNVMLHWIYAGWFFDALIWHRLIRERRWHLSDEFWRALLLLGTFGTMGYTWGPNILEWELVRAGIAITILASRRGPSPISIEFAWRKLVLPTVLGLGLLAIDLRWFIPLLREALKHPEIPQGSGWSAHLLQVIRPLWLDPVLHFFGWQLPIPEDWAPGLKQGLATFDGPETVVSIGWFWLIPLSLSLNAVRKSRGGAGIRVLAPFLLLSVIAILYFSVNHVPGIGLVTPLVQKFVPFMKYFRTLCRWGIFLTPMAGVMILLSWPELTASLKRLKERMGQAAFVALLAFFISASAIEVSLLGTPVAAFPKLPDDARAMYEKIRALPGESVLTFPICVAGANGVCTSEQCPTWPQGTLTHCTRLFHDKKVYGAYTSRMNFSDCDIYGRRAPFPAWFNAWRTQRCFSESEWADVCHYLDAHTEISALLVFPDIWRAAGDPACEASFQSHLGVPIQETRVVDNYSRDPAHAPQSRIRWYPSHCLKAH